MLKEDMGAIEDGIRVDLDWQPKPDKKRCLIQHEWSADPTDRDAWPRQHSRIRELLNSFHDAFSERLRQLDPDDWVPPEQEEAV